jgi:hypothetical protein
MLGLISQHIPSVLDDIDEDAMARDLAVTESSGGGARSRGGDGKTVVTVRKEWTFHRCVPQRIRPVSLLVLSPVNLGSRASYSHGGRSPLLTDIVVTPSIKTLKGV